MIAAKKSGHSVYCITARVDNEKNRREVVIPGVETTFCGFSSKVNHMKATKGIAIDVWIDDDPAMCVFEKQDAPMRIKSKQRFIRR